MLKINWGTKIAVLYIGFVGLIVVMVVMSMHQKIDLVSEDYYNKELMFQDKINEMKNTNSLSGTITHTITNTAIELQFQPEFKTKKVTGEILFFRPSDSSKDFTTAVSLDENAEQKISLNKLSKGMYKMQISWKDESKGYFAEETIIIP
jgi:hypothetical protein